MKKERKPETKCIFEEIEHHLSVVADSVEMVGDYVKANNDAKGGKLFNSIRTNLDKARALLRGAIDSKAGDVTEQSVCHFDILQQIQQVCSTHDQLFLQRQLRYKVTASADLPQVFANPDQIFVVLSHLLSNAIKFSPRSGEIDVKVKEVSLRQGTGVEVSVVNASENFTEKDRYRIFERFYSTKSANNTPAAGLGLAVCRDISQKSGGQLWVDIPSKGKVAFTFVLPCTEINFPLKEADHRTYKYDISISNYEELREEMGDGKFSALLVRIEEEVRSLVRHPIDVVAAFEAHGVVSVIYETMEGNASSVATRISKKLGTGEFKGSKSPVPVTLKYHLSLLQ